MTTDNGRYVNSNNIFRQWYNQILESGLDIYILRRYFGLSKEIDADGKNGCALICEHTYEEDDNHLVIDFINEMKPLFVMVIHDVDGDGEHCDLTNMINDNADYKIIKRMIECRFDYEYITSIYSTDKSITYQGCIEYERGEGVIWSH